MSDQLGKRGQESLSDLSAAAESELELIGRSCLRGLAGGKELPELRDQPAVSHLAQFEIEPFVLPALKFQAHLGGRSAAARLAFEDRCHAIPFHGLEATERAVGRRRLGSLPGLLELLKGDAIVE